MMREMTDRLGRDPELAAAYQRAHEDYLRRRAELGSVPEIEGTSAGGMPTRVKCLHVLVGHSLAAGPGVNPLGDEALAALPQWWAAGSCVSGTERPDRRGWHRRGAGEAGTARPGHDAGRRDRLRHQLDPPAGRRRGPGAGLGPRRWSTWCAGWRSSGSATGSTAPARSPPRRWPARWRWRATTPRSARSSRSSGSGSWRPRPPVTPATPPSSSTACAPPSRRTASPPRWSPGTRRPRCRSAARPAGCRRTASTAPTSWSTSAAGPPSSSAAPSTSTRPGRSTSAASG